MFVVEDDTFSDVEDYYTVALLPLLLGYFAGLTSQCRRLEQNQVYFLSREGEFLAAAFNAFCASRKLAIIGVPVICSRAFLTKCVLSDDVVDLLLQAHYTGTVASFFSDKLAVDEALLLEIGFKQQILNSTVRLPQDAGRVRLFMSQYCRHPLSKVSERRAEYHEYLMSLGPWSGSSIVADVGYSGSLQRLLMKFLDHDLYAAYIITTKRAGQIKELKKLVWALFAEVADFGEGHPFLDSSLILEVLMSASYGQCEDVCRRTSGQVDFKFGPRGRAQFAHPVFDLGQRRVIEEITSFADIDLATLAAPSFVERCRNLLQNVLVFRDLTPKLIQHVGDVDDRISGLGFITPWSFLTPLARRTAVAASVTP